MPSLLLTTAMLASSTLAASSTSSSLQVTLKSGFWYGNFSLGSSSSAAATLLIDTGSAHVAANPGKYDPSSSSSAVSLNSTFSVTYGTTNSDGSGSLTISGDNYNDTVSFGSSSVKATSQQVGLVVVSDKATDGTYPEDGIIGFGGLCTSEDCPTTFMQTLCRENALTECRFGLALGTNGSGELIVGKTDTTLFDGDLATSSTLAEWYLLGDVMYGTDNTAVAQGVPVLLDSGSSTLIGPVDDVKAIFDKAGVQYVEATTADGKTVTGYHACDDVPTLGFSFPSVALTNKTGTPFTVPSSTMTLQDNGDNNCTSILSGQDMPLEQLDGAKLWVVGQPFFQGHYLDFDMRDEATPMVGIAKLKSSSSSPGSGSGDDGDKDSAAVVSIRGASSMIAAFGLAAIAMLL